MKKFSFKKIGILLAMMLVAGAVLVGPASAYAENTESSGAGSFWVSATGNLISSDFASYSGYTWLKNSGTADRIYVKAQIFNYGNNLVFSDPDTKYGVSELEVSGTRTASYDRPYAKTTMNSDVPDDMGFVCAYGI
ncbi:MAG: hypothetical protein PHV39_04140 [Methanomicrobium sp.]|nr:hypothetical protein [Methanomicrobium sp.]